jgi:hypothetical protein
MVVEAGWEGMETWRERQALAMLAMKDGKRTREATVSKSAGKPIAISRSSNKIWRRAWRNVALLKNESCFEIEDSGGLVVAVEGLFCVTRRLNLRMNGSARHSDPIQLQRKDETGNTRGGTLKRRENGTTDAHKWGQQYGVVSEGKRQELYGRGSTINTSSRMLAAAGQRKILKIRIQIRFGHYTSPKESRQTWFAVNRLNDLRKTRWKSPGSGCVRKIAEFQLRHISAACCTLAHRHISLKKSAKCSTAPRLKPTAEKLKPLNKDARQMRLYQRDGKWYDV